MKQKSTTRTYEFSVYDLNMAQTLKQDLPFALKNEQITNTDTFNKDHFLTQLWKSVEMYCRDNGLDYDYLLKSPASVPIIIESKHHLYFHFLEAALMFYDPFLIKYFLTHQYNNFKGNRDAKNKEEFLGKILFLIYPHIKLISPNNNLHRKEKIFDWLESHNAGNLPERFSMVKPDNRYKGQLTPEEITRYWMQLCNYKKKNSVVQVLNEAEVKQFLHANFWGFPQSVIEKLNTRYISQTEFRIFCKNFFDSFKNDNQSSEFLAILKANFTIFDNTKIENLKKDFSKK